MPDVRLGPLTFQYDPDRREVHVVHREEAKAMLEAVPAKDWAEFEHTVRIAVDALNAQLVPDALPEEKLRQVVREEVTAALDSSNLCRYGADY